jgi:hypothetical protein
MLLMVTAFGKNVPKYGAEHKRFGLKHIFSKFFK